MHIGVSVFDKSKGNFKKQTVYKVLAIPEDASAMAMSLVRHFLLSNLVGRGNPY